MDRYVDPSFAALAPATRACWAASAPARQAVTVGTTGFATVAAADPAAGDVVWLAPGPHAAPASLRAGVVVRGLAGYLATLACSAVVALPAGAVRFHDLAVVGAGGGPASPGDLLLVPAGGTAGFANCTFTPPAAGQAVGVVGADAGAAFAGCTGATWRLASGGAAAKFPGPAVRAGGPLGRPLGNQRQRVVVEAPARSRSASGDSVADVWVPVGAGLAEIVPARGREFEEARVQVFECSHLIRLRGGAVASETMRVREADTGAVYQITAVLAFDGRDGRIDLAAVRGSTL